MTDYLELADHYYAVARDLQRDAQFTLACADMLNRHADELCELNMKQQKTPPDRASQPQSAALHDEHK